MIIKDNENEYKCGNCNLVSKNVIPTIDENKKEKAKNIEKDFEKEWKAYKIKEKEYEKIVEDHNNKITKHWYQKLKSKWIFKSCYNHFYITENGKVISEYPCISIKYPSISIKYHYLDMFYVYIECPVCNYKLYI